MMNKILFISMGLLLLVTHLHAGEIQTEISRVVVYEDRAMVTRRGEVDLPEGAQEVVLPGLPPMLMDDSVRVAGRAGGNITITGTEVRKTFLTDPRRAEVEKLTKKLEQLREERGGLDDGLESLLMQKKFIEIGRAHV